MSVKFGSATGERPVTLSETTREMCAKALDGFFGRRILETPFVKADDIPGFENMSMREKYAAALDRIVEECPVYINDGELIVGSASLGDAILPVVPVKYRDGYVFGWGANHVTMGFDEALRKGLDAYEREIDGYLSADCDAERTEVRISMKRALASLRRWHQRYMEALEGKINTDPQERLKRIRDNLKTVPFAPPQTFYQALQSLWFSFAFARLSANWPGLGRMDEYLWPYLREDLEHGRTDMKEAKEQLAHFMIKGCEWINLSFRGTGDAQHYQNIVLGGIDESGRDISNPVTRMVLEIFAELPISDFPVAVRLNEQTPEWVHELIAQNVAFGGGVVAVYNESTVLKALENYGYPYKEAVRFANDGCWEVQVPGKTWFSYVPFDGYAIFQAQVLKLGEAETPEYKDYDAMYAAYTERLKEKIDDIWACDEKKCPECAPPVPFCELLTKGCAKKGMPYYYFGPEYNVDSPHFGGFAETVNALFAIKHFVFDTGRYTLREYTDMLRADWNGFEVQRREAAALDYWGADSSEADEIAVRLAGDYADICDRDKFHHTGGMLRPAGISTFGRQTDWRNDRFSHAFGRKNGEILSGNCSPTPGTDINGVTSVIRAHCALPLYRFAGSTALDIKLDPSVFRNTDITQVVRSLTDGFVSLGGFFMQMDTVDNEALRRAQENPEAYKGLAVRVSGWSARFVTLSREWQDTVIERTSQKI